MINSIVDLILNLIAKFVDKLPSSNKLPETNWHWARDCTKIQLLKILRESQYLSCPDGTVSHVPNSTRPEGAITCTLSKSERTQIEKILATVPNHEKDENIIPLRAP